jgi:hypothetical protein
VDARPIVVGDTVRCDFSNGSGAIGTVIRVDSSQIPYLVEYEKIEVVRHETWMAAWGVTLAPPCVDDAGDPVKERATVIAHAVATAVSAGDDRAVLVAAGSAQWFFAWHRDDERWSGPEDTREGVIEVAQQELDSGPDDAATVYVVRGERPEVVELCQFLDLDSLRDQMIDYASDNGLIGEDTELEFAGEGECERELQAVLAKHLVRPNWWVCDGQSAEAVELKKGAGQDPNARMGDCPYPGREKREGENV